jgi:hypothetical protein
MTALAESTVVQYDCLKVLATPNVAVPRTDQSGFFVPSRFRSYGGMALSARLGAGLHSGCKHPPARAFASAASLECRSIPA